MEILKAISVAIVASILVLAVCAVLNIPDFFAGFLAGCMFLSTFNEAINN